LTVAKVIAAVMAEYFTHLEAQNPGLVDYFIIVESGMLRLRVFIRNYQSYSPIGFSRIRSANLSFSVGV